MLPGTKTRNEGTFGCSPGTKHRNEGTCGCSRYQKKNEGTFVFKQPFYETALLSPLDRILYEVA